MNSTANLPRGRTTSRRARRESGASRRSETPLESHSECPSESDRADPIAILKAQDVTRQQSLVPIRHGRMGATAFTFYRGAAAIMASDLSKTPTTDLRTQLCGDAHLSNFGLFKGPDRRLVFDLNDFDETLPGPFEWDVKRLAASVTIAGRNNGLPSKEISRATRAAVKSYRQTMFAAAQKSPLALHYLRLESAEILVGLDKKDRKQHKKVSRKARRKDSVRALSKLTDIVDGRRVIIPNPPLITRVDDILERNGIDELERFFDQYRSTLPYYRQVLLDRYSVLDIAHKVVGVGSVGTRCVIVLLESGGGSPLFLQFKEATESVLEPYAGASDFELAGERVVVGQRLMQSTGDIFLGWSRLNSEVAARGVDFYFRQMWDGKGSAEVDEMGDARLKRYAKACGGALALAHARAGDASMISGYLGDESTFDHAVTAFSSSYADLNDTDHQAHRQAIESGQLEAVLDL
jgi:uncharacterized protein (DUF2252 family)